jgi:hypothetical protein
MLHKGVLEIDNMFGELPSQALLLYEASTAPDGLLIADSAWPNRELYQK